jgi:hypothetical protein
MIRRELGDTIVITRGNEPASTQVTVEAYDQDNCVGHRYQTFVLRIKEAGTSETGILLSLETIQKIVAWAEK